jgi:hypothetical protein
MRGSWTLPRSLVFGGALSAAMVIATLSVFLAVEKQVAGAAPDYRVAAVGGMHYEAMDGRPLDPANATDRKIIAGLPAADVKLRHGEMLFGAFISFTNSSSQTLRSASLIELRHDSGPVDQPLPLPQSNPYAYSARLVRPHSRIPGAGSPAADNLAAGGRLLVFRIRASEYNNSGTFELVIHDPLHPDRTASLFV